MLNLMVLTTCLLSIIFLFIKHPLSMGFTLLLQTILMSLISGLFNYNYWFSYILFLVMIGGMLILFIYMTSVASNKKFKFSIKLMILTLMFILLMILTKFTDLFYSYNNMMNSDSMFFFNQSNNSISLMKFINQPNNLILMMIIVYLFITLIMVAKISCIEFGPLRQKF